jgi:hypothetical protein
MDRKCFSVVVVVALIFFFAEQCSVLPPSMQRDQKGKADAEHDERNEEVTIGQDGAKFVEFGHWGM